MFAYGAIRLNVKDKVSSKCIDRQRYNRQVEVNELDWDNVLSWSWEKCDQRT
uniref:Uncharacterized protein n=1 Tax=Medicago truncatula TaxID=3880 RepID=Q2HT73_MEDTR|nr:hypothetical protein MtrDRAFT_AC150777g8v1 [Medicago truncatula]